MLRTNSARPVLLKDYKAPTYLVSNVDLDFQLHSTETIVTATTSYFLNKGEKTGASLELDGDGLSFISAKLNGKPLEPKAFNVTEDAFILVNPPKKFNLEIVTKVDPTSNTALSGLYRSGGNYCTQCEAQGFRRITYFLDRPDVLAPYTVRLEVDESEAPLLLSNGNPGKTGKIGKDRHFAIWHDPHPKPSYLFALVGGDLDHIHEDYVTSEGREVRLGIYVEKGKSDRAGYAMDALIRSMRWDEEVFGLAYDLDVFNIVAVSDFNMGAMENKGLNIFNDKYVLADKQTATDVDFARIEAIIAHEYFHNWTGNRITCRDWFQLCLKEGLTVYRDQEFSSDMRSRAVKRIEDVVGLRGHQFPEDAGPLAHPVRPDSYREINNFYTATIYEKGAEIVRMIATLLGEKNFANGMKRYLKKHDGDAATVEDFLNCFEFVSRRDLSQFFLWYEQAGTPSLHVASDYDAARKTFTVEIEQSQSPTAGQSRKKPLLMPLRIGLMGMVSGKEIAFEKATGPIHHGDVFEIDKRKQKIVFHGVTERPALSINRNFSAPVEVNYRHTDKELIFLAANDVDQFNRWQAFRTIASRQILSGMRAIQRKKKPKWNLAFLEAAKEIAANEALEPAFRSMALTLPAESELARLIGRNIDPDAIHNARKALQSALGEALEETRIKTSKTLKPDADYSAAAEEAGKRSLYNLLLSYGVHAGSEQAEKAVVKQFKSADNMNQNEFAFRIILQEMADTPDAEKAVASFYKTFQNDQIVLDKWFTTQAITPGKGALKCVRGLIAHPEFKWTNPNRVRSVIAAFATANPTGFNRADGAGYRLVADAVSKLDEINPQIASRLLTAFRSWRTLEPNRRKLAEASLKKLKRQKGLSRDVSEILDRTLS
ncbi:MAG: aminopeptidase N [Salaquimonas sp.]